MTHLRSDKVRPRKPRICDWCGEEIPAGTEAVYTVSVDGGDLLTGYDHPECSAAATELYQEDPDIFDCLTPCMMRRGGTEPR